MESISCGRKISLESIVLGGFDFKYVVFWGEIGIYGLLVVSGDLILIKIFELVLEEYFFGVV